MVIFASFLVAVSVAVTLMMPLASMSNFTSICGTPRGAGGSSLRLKLPSETLSAAIGRSPCTTCMVTEVWLSAAVVKTLPFEVGIVVLRSMRVSRTPPSTSMPSVRGVTSSSTMSLSTSPAMMPACMAAPMATASIGSTPDSASRPIIPPMNLRTSGMRVGPPTSTTRSIPWADSFASDSDFSTDGRHFSTTGPISSSSFARVRRSSRFLAPDDGSCAMNGRLMSVSMTLDSSIFAFSAASRMRVMAVESDERSLPSFFLNSSSTYSTSAWSMSVPPSLVSPEVLITSNTPPPISMMVTSSVPPPKSNTIIFMSCLDLSRPKASEAAVGSLIMRTTSRPAIVPASFVAWRWLSSK